MANTAELQGTWKQGTHTATDGQQQLLHDARRIQTELHLEIESFYLFAKILLDNVTRAVEYYFGPARGLALDSHDDLAKRLEAYTRAKNLSEPPPVLRAD